MVTVNRTPFNLMPEEWAFDDVKGPFMRAVLDELWQLRDKGGGDVDTFDTVSSELHQQRFQVPRDEVQAIPYWLPVVGTYYAGVSTAHTTAGNEIIEATAALTVTLNATPDDEERVTVKRNGSGIVTLDANSKTIDGASTYDLIVNYESVTVVYLSDEWLII